MTDTNQQLKFQVQQELDDISLSVMAYRAEQIVSAISTANQKTYETVLARKSDIRKDFQKSLETMRGGDAFSPERIQEIINRYTPLSALNKDGAGHILFSDQHNPNTIHVAMRGSEEFLADWLRADTGNIAIGDVPMHQFVNHLNDLSIHVTASGQPAPQFSYQIEQDAIGNYFPHLVQVKPAQGDGLAYGRQLTFEAHSESSPYAALMSDIFDGRATSLNGPTASTTTMLDLVNEARQAFNKPVIQELGHHHTSYHTTGVSIIDGYWGGLPGNSTTIATINGSHSSIEAMHARETAINLLQNNPKIQDRNTLEQLTKEYVLNPERGEQIIKVFNEHKGATPETATEWVDLERGRKFVSISGVKVGEQWFQDATTKMQEADKQAEKLENLQQINQREMSRLQSQPKQTIHQPVPHHAPQNSIHHRTHTHQLTPNLLSIPNPETSQHGVININTSDMSIIPQHSDKQPKKTSEDAYGGDLPMGEIHQPSRPKNANQPLYNDGKDIHDMRLDRQNNAEVPYRLRSDATEQINPDLQMHLASATQTSKLMAFPPSHDNPMLQALLQNPVFTTLPPEQQTALIAGAGGQVSNLVTPSFDEPNINNATAASVNEFINLPPRVASLHAQITEKFGDQIAHLSEKDQQTTIALATREAMSFYARTVDYVFVNQQGDVCISFDGDKGFSGDVNLNQVHHQDANQVLLASIDRQQSQLQELSMQRAQSQNQNPTMSI